MFIPFDLTSKIKSLISHKKKFEKSNSRCPRNTKIQMIMKEYYKNYILNKLDNIEEMDILLETYNL